METAALEAQIANLERREAALKAEEATLPTRGRHRSAWLKVSKELARVTQDLKEAREALEWSKQIDAEEAREEAEYIANTTPEERAYHEEMLERYEREVAVPLEERRKRDVAAKKRRAKFRLILGGKHGGSV